MIDLTQIQDQALYWSTALLCTVLGFLMAKAKHGQQQEDLAEIQRILDGFRLKGVPEMSIRNRWLRLKMLTAPRNPSQLAETEHEEGYVGRHRRAAWRRYRRPVANLGLEPGTTPHVVEVFE